MLNRLRERKKKVTGEKESHHHLQKKQGQICNMNQYTLQDPSTLHQKSPFSPQLQLPLRVEITTTSHTSKEHTNSEYHRTSADEMIPEISKFGESTHKS